MEVVDFVKVERGYGDGYGDGSGSGDGLKTFNNQPIYLIDNVPTIIDKIKLNVAFGHILNRDLTLTKCYVIKQNNMFAHGETLEQARTALADKMFEGMSEEERIVAFLEEFEQGKKYPAMTFFEWHNRLTGSCEAGRRSFAKNHEIDLDNDQFTIGEFIALTENDYGGQVIKELLKRVKS
jgi:hypothetical protein